MTEQELVEKLRETIKHACKEGTQGWSIFEGLRSDFTESDINQICEVAAEQALSAIRESGYAVEENWELIESAPAEIPVQTAHKHKGKWVFRVGKRDRLGRFLTMPGEMHYEPHFWKPLSPPTAAEQAGKD